ncbi:hypothetical protein COX69_03090 [Candidatus Falkowbacteria bacterium CG_4_10_14_0_2_um_filter_48_10]|uniref:Uncharacterized protein n=1 Tax=Candidatus Falkowbacteria bacterium CG23_combo_of_CG06-09_8_20_14_all_49_15 TaxID=1974572 RepID=A0A2G9ZKN7_9BACT|nr:MAG: hypothetical protein COX22_02730 [Candidatus Falkowbacteria bacterium CG23_combo_of_CG06-09_8_20_14_all_49_15]PJA08116.1 MAG: hypothetical protein COX69_03090 [Candidatus Falkowbacteria bacterium CG_4_10_14_0_2_um_filter_48_10]
MSDDKLQKLNNYFIRYIDKMLIEDIKLLKERNEELKFSYPYLLLACSCIDLFGAIEKGFKSPTGQGNTRERFTWFVIEWMGKINSLYKNADLAYLIYDSWRCCVVHQATLKKGFETSSYMYPREKHLNYITDNGRVFIHSLQFADDLIEAQKKYRKQINDNAGNTTYVDLLYNHLLDMMGDETKQCFDRFVKFLQDNNLVFNSTDSLATTGVSPHTSTATSSKLSSQDTVTRLPDRDDSIWATVSAAPDEDDLK